MFVFLNLQIIVYRFLNTCRIKLVYVSHSTRLHYPIYNGHIAKNQRLHFILKCIMIIKTACNESQAVNKNAQDKCAGGSEVNMEPKKVSDSITEQLRVVIYPDINGFGRLFGGRLLAWIDEVAGATARRHCGRDATTVAIDNLHFKSGAYLNDIIVLIGKITFVGRTSMEVRVDTYREDADGTRHPINRAYFVMVAVQEDGRPTEVPGLILENDGEKMEWENAKKRREFRLLRKQEGF